MKPQFVIGAPASNAGKTTVTLGLLRAFQLRGLKVQPFKCGPDYIDPKFHQKISGVPSVNLDAIMMSNDHLKHTYQCDAQAADVALIEGVMGLFDGAIKSKGSTAALSKELKLPVVLVVDAKAMAYSVAPLLYGFKSFDPEVELAGVLFNRVGSQYHYRLLEEACEEVGISSFGYVPYTEEGQLPSRHLGLSLDTLNTLTPIIDQVAERMNETVRLDELLEAVCRPFAPAAQQPEEIANKQFKVGVARDEAFNFIYQQNLKKLKQYGEVTFFSPLQDDHLPEVDLLYLPGGYPELQARQLADNAAMLESIRQFLTDGGKAIAECGGLMYLGESLTDKEGKTHNMVGALGLKTSMQAMKLSLGYRKVRWEEQELTGHEFHYSTSEETKTIPKIGKVCNIREKEVRTPVYLVDHVLASYIHLYFGEDDPFKRIMNLLNIPI